MLYCSKYTSCNKRANIAVIIIKKRIISDGYSLIEHTARYVKIMCILKSLIHSNSTFIKFFIIKSV